jgi:hypothetical protein
MPVAVAGLLLVSPLQGVSAHPAATKD